MLIEENTIENLYIWHGVDQTLCTPSFSKKGIVIQGFGHQDDEPLHSPLATHLKELTHKKNIYREHLHMCACASQPLAYEFEPSTETILRHGYFVFTRVVTRSQRQISESSVHTK